MTEDWQQRARDARAARLRAAWAFSGASYAELAERANVPVAQLMKWCAHKGPRRGRATDAETYRVAAAAGVPGWFMATGWDGAVDVLELVEAWSNGRIDEEIKGRWIMMLRALIAERDPELELRLRIHEALDDLDPGASPALRELLRWLGRAPDISGRSAAPAATTDRGE